MRLSTSSSVRKASLTKPCSMLQCGGGPVVSSGGSRVMMRVHVHVCTCTCTEHVCRLELYPVCRPVPYEVQFRLCTWRTTDGAPSLLCSTLNAPCVEAVREATRQ